MSDTSKAPEPVHGGLSEELRKELFSKLEENPSSESTATGTEGQTTTPESETKQPPAVTSATTDQPSGSTEQVDRDDPSVDPRDKRIHELLNEKNTRQQREKSIRDRIAKDPKAAIEFLRNDVGVEYELSDLLKDDSPLSQLRNADQFDPDFKDKVIAALEYQKANPGSEKLERLFDSQDSAGTPKNPLEDTETTYNEFSRFLRDFPEFGLSGDPSELDSEYRSYLTADGTQYAKPLNDRMVKYENMLRMRQDVIAGKAPSLTRAYLSEQNVAQKQVLQEGAIPGTTTTDNIAPSGTSNNLNGQANTITGDNLGSILRDDMDLDEKSLSQMHEIIRSSL